MFVDLRGEERPATRADADTLTVIPAFVISELQTAFQLGFVIRAFLSDRHDRG